MNTANRTTSTSPTLAALPFLLALGASLLLVAILWHALARIPVAFGDQYEEIVLVYNTSLADTLTHYIERGGSFFRPLEYVWRHLIAYGLDQGAWGYNLFQGLLLTATAVLFTALCRPRTKGELIAYLPALCILFGHAAMQGTWELNIVFSNGLVLTLMIVALMVIKGQGGILSQLIMLLVTAVSLLTKEVGLVVPGVFVLAHLLGMRGARRWTAVLVSLLVVAYLGYRLSGEKDLIEITPGKAHEVWGYLSNIIATFVMFWLGAPTDGEWRSLPRDFMPIWPLLRVVAGLSVAGVLAAAWTLTRDRGARSDSDPELDHRWFLLFGAALMACSVLGFYYTRHRHGAPALPLLAYCAYLSLRLLLARLEAAPQTEGAQTGAAGPLARWMGMALLGCALFWPLRVVTGFEFARGLGMAVQASWSEDMDVFWERMDPEQRPLFGPFTEAVDQMPLPILNIPVLHQLGTRQAVSR